MFIYFYQSKKITVIYSYSRRIYVLLLHFRVSILKRNLDSM
nr:MAG TPA: hypothetical protein [Caudoviricetes sp.]